MRDLGEVDFVRRVPRPAVGVDCGDLVEVHAGTGDGDDVAAVAMSAFDGGHELASRVGHAGAGVFAAADLVRLAAPVREALQRVAARARQRRARCW
jgi:fructose-1,6-bisphosphatase/sedoheptulose 1,7-bisphosphatase-like protein